MTAHNGSVQDIAHRLRVAAHQHAAYVNTLVGCEAFQRADLRQFSDMIAEAADALSPIHSVHDEPAGNVVRLVRPVLSPVSLVTSVEWTGESVQ